TPGRLDVGGVVVVHIQALRVVHTAVAERDVEVTQHDHPRVRLQLAGDPVVHGVQPAQLVRVLLRADVLAIDHVQVDHAHPADGRGYDAFLLVAERRYADLDVRG